MPLLKATLTRFPPAEERFEKSSEPVLQTVEIPLSVFVREQPELDPEAIRWIRFRFDRSPAGVIALDEIGIRPPARN